MSEMKPILVVDDDIDICEALQDMLELRGYTVQTATSAKEAIEAVERNRFCLAIVDLVMQPVDGTVIIAGLKERHPDIPVIVMSAMGADNELVKEIKKEYIITVLQKPLDLELLYKSISEATGR